MVLHYAPELHVKMQSRCTVHFCKQLCTIGSHTEHVQKLCQCAAYSIRDSPFVQRLLQNSHLQYTLNTQCSVGALLMYPVSELTYALKVYNVDWTNSVLCTCKLNLWVHLKLTLHVHCERLNALTAHSSRAQFSGAWNYSVLCMYTVHRWWHLQRTLHMSWERAVYTASALCIVASTDSVQCKCWVPLWVHLEFTVQVNNAPVSSLSIYTERTKYSVSVFGVYTTSARCTARGWWSCESVLTLHCMCAVKSRIHMRCVLSNMCTC